MACNGYSPKAIRLDKSTKRIAATILDAHERGEFIRRNIDLIRANNAARSQRSKKDD